LTAPSAFDIGDRMTRIGRLGWVLVAALAAFLPARGGAADAAVPLQLRAQVIQSYPHDAKAFTQGLLLHDGTLYESTGLYGHSSLRKVELATGKVLQRVDLPANLFGEGLALAGGRLVQLTWKEGVAPTYDLATLAKNGEFTYTGEGWGLCFDGTQFIQTDGSHRLIFRDPKTFAVTRQLAITTNGQPVTGLNELECVGDSVYANIYQTNRIVEIVKLNGSVRAVIDASGLLNTAEQTALDPAALLNGIAHDPADGTFLLTGKLWPKLFRVRFIPR
jgi:glutamine cyclotransferase